MKKLICLLLIVAVLTIPLGLFSLNVGAEGWFYYPLKSPSLIVLLYTDIAQELTIFKGDPEGGDIIGREYDWFIGNRGDGYFEFFLYSPEINDATVKCRTGSFSAMEARCALRECVQYFDISKEELMQAYETMKEDPDAIRPILSFLTDEEFNSAKREDGTFGFTEWSQEIIDALYIEDDAEAHRILCDPYAVYICELGRVVTDKELFFEFWPVSVDELATYDLTSDEMGMFLTYVRSNMFNKDQLDMTDGRTNLEKLEYLESTREKQLAAKAGREAAFVGELGSMLTAERLFGTAEEAPTVTVAELAVCDLTGEDMGNFLVYLRENIESYESTADPADGRTPLEKLEYLEAQREAQLKAAQTGDGAADGVLVLVLAIPALAAAVIVKRKRRI